MSVTMSSDWLQGGFYGCVGPGTSVLGFSDDDTMIKLFDDESDDEYW